MSTLTPSSVPSLNQVKFDSTVIMPDEAQLESPLNPPWISTEDLRFRIKRAVDWTGALVGLIMLCPLFLLIALAIRLDSPGPVLFRQLRRGYRGRLFRMLKFRTMIPDAEQRLDELEDSNESDGVLFKFRRDPRVTRLGRFLRWHSLDEFPQLINVLKGEMSLVGPRPLQLRDSDRLRDSDPQGYAGRLQVLPGVTGPWQVGGRSEVDSDRMVELDLDYVANWSLGRDLKIIGKTFLVVLLRRGAY
jgi:lipopolysaccharide/colanic/teichoic acid biosynthesis glycosyltransferase